MLIDNIIKFCSHLKLLIVVVAVTVSFPFTPRLQYPRHNCYRIETAEELSLRLHFLLLQPWFCF